jgi:hypothetical protein
MVKANNRPAATAGVTAFTFKNIRNSGNFQDRDSEGRGWELSAFSKKTPY